MKNFTKTIALPIMLLGASAANATNIESVVFNGFQQWSDNSAEVLVKGPNNTDLAKTGILEVGDQLQGIFNIGSFEQNPSTLYIGVNGINELTGIFNVQVTSVSGAPGAYFFNFGPTTFSAGPVGSLNILTGNEVVAFYQDPAADYTRLGTSISADVTSASNGFHFLNLGFDGSNTFWSAIAVTNDIAIVGATAAPAVGGFYNLGLNISDNDSGLTFGKVLNFNNQLVDFAGSGSLLGTGGVATPFQSFDNVDFTTNVQVPEPSMLALIGLGLVGMGYFRKGGKKA